MPGCGTVLVVCARSLLPIITSVACGLASCRAHCKPGPSSPRASMALRTCSRAWGQAHCALQMALCRWVASEPAYSSSDPTSLSLHFLACSPACAARHDPRGLPPATSVACPLQPSTPHRVHDGAAGAHWRGEERSHQCGRGPHRHCVIRLHNQVRRRVLGRRRWHAARCTWQHVHAQRVGCPPPMGHVGNTQGCPIGPSCHPPPCLRHAGCARRVWEVPEELLATLEGHTDEVMCVALTPDCSTCVSGSRDKTARCARALPSTPGPASGDVHGTAASWQLWLAAAGSLAGPGAPGALEHLLTMSGCTRAAPRTGFGTWQHGSSEPSSRGTPLS